MKIKQQLILGLAGISLIALGACAHKRDHKSSHVSHNSQEHYSKYEATPFDQGTSRSDLNTTAEIRRQIVSGKYLSTNAKNIKVITNRDRIVLRGRVKNSDERNHINRIAVREAGSRQVDNQLVIKN